MDNDTTLLKKCAKCKVEYPLTAEHYHRHAGNKSGFHSRCKTCILDEMYPGTREKKAELSKLEAQGLKRCAMCDEVKPATVEYFSRDSRRDLGLQPKCKACNKAYRQANIEHRIRTQKEWYRLNVDAVRERAKARRSETIHAQRLYNARNRDRIRKRSRAYRERKKEQLREYNRMYRRNNKHIFVAKDNRRAARKRELPCNFTGHHWQICLEYWHGCCAVCGNQLRDLFGDVEPHADHWIPLSYKGSDNPGTVASNIVCLCSQCNLSKNDKDAKEWLIQRYEKRKAREILKRITTYFEWIKQQ